MSWKSGRIKKANKKVDDEGQQKIRRSDSTIMEEEATKSFNDQASKIFATLREKSQRESRDEDATNATDDAPVTERMFNFACTVTIDHTSTKYRMWEFVVIVLVLWNAIYTPLSIAFLSVEPDGVVEWGNIVDVLFVCGELWLLWENAVRPLRV